MSLRYTCYKKVAAISPQAAFFCEYLFYAAQIQIERPGFVLVSYPKCGRTWLHFMLRRYFSRKYGTDETERMIAMSRFEKRIPSMILTHDGKSTHWWNRRKRAYRRTHIAFLSRDPRDAIISHFHHCRDRDGIYHDELSSFIRHPDYGMPVLIDFMNEWLRHRDKVRDFILCRYEDLKANPESEMRVVLAFLGETEIDESALAAALADGSIDSMRKAEQQGTLRMAGTERSGEAPNAMKVRNGKVGGYREALSRSDRTFVDRLVQERLDAEFGYV